MLARELPSVTGRWTGVLAAELVFQGPATCLILEVVAITKVYSGLYPWSLLLRH